MTGAGETRIEARTGTGGRLSGRWPVLLSFLALLLAAAAPAPPPAADGDAARARDRLARIESELAERARRQGELADAAAAAGREAEALSRRLVAVAAEVQRQEERVQALGLKVETLGEMLAEEEARLARRRAQMAHILAALVRLSRRPPALALLRPGEADAAITSALVLRDLTPRLAAEARAIAEQVRQIKALRADLAAQRARLGADLAALGARRAELDALRAEREAERRRLLGAAASEATAMKELAAKARTLEDLLAALDAERARRLRAAREAARRLGSNAAIAAVPPTSAPFASARGTLPLPVRGRLVKGFGDESEGLHERGITIAALPGAQVVAPYDGRVVFAGPFRGYGQLLIIAHGGGYHTLLAGMERIYATVGQWVLAGEPVGVMAAGDTRAAAVSEKTATAPRLYVELRQGGEPVDPLPWLAAGLRKVS